MAAPTEAVFRVKEFFDASKVEIRSNVDPITLQAESARKCAFQDALGEAVKDATTGVYTHDVEVTLIWFVAESRRYQTHLIADLDNVMKPILEAVTGPDGILIDDNQIQSIRAMWMTPGTFGAGFELTFESLMRDDFVTREGLSFVEFAADRCYILHGSLGEHAAEVVSAFRRMVATYHDLVSRGMPEAQARGVLPLVRPYPRARLGRFKLSHESEFPEPV